jgi:hypothetical protein
MPKKMMGLFAAFLFGLSGLAQAQQLAPEVVSLQHPTMYGGSTIEGAARQDLRFTVRAVARDGWNSTQHSTGSPVTFRLEFFNNAGGTFESGVPAAFANAISWPSGWFCWGEPYDASRGYGHGYCETSERAFNDTSIDIALVPNIGADGQPAHASGSWRVQALYPNSTVVDSARRLYAFTTAAGDASVVSMTPNVSAANVGDYVQFDVRVRASASPSQDLIDFRTNFQASGMRISNIRHSGANATNRSCNTNNQSCYFQRQDGFERITVSAQITGDSATATLTASVEHSGRETNTSNDSMVRSVQVNLPSTDWEMVSVTPALQTGFVGQPNPVELVVRNNGPNADAATVGIQVFNATHTVEQPVQISLAPGESQTVVLDVTFNEENTTNSYITAFAIGQLNELNTGNRAEILPLYAINQVFESDIEAVGVEAVQPISDFFVGSNKSFSATVRNNGPDEGTTSVTVIARHSDGTTYTLFNQVINLTNNQEQQVTFSFAPEKVGDYFIQLIVDSPNDDPTPANNRANTQLTARYEVDLGIERIEHADGDITRGESESFSVVIQNNSVYTVQRGSLVIEAVDAVITSVQTPGCGLSGQSISCLFEPMGASGQQTVLFDATPSSDQFEVIATAAVEDIGTEPAVEVDTNASNDRLSRVFASQYPMPALRSVSGAYLHGIWEGNDSYPRFVLSDWRFNRNDYENASWRVHLEQRPYVQEVRLLINGVPAMACQVAVGEQSCQGSLSLAALGAINQDVFVEVDAPLVTNGWYRPAGQSISASYDLQDPTISVLDVDAVDGTDDLRVFVRAAANDAQDAINPSELGLQSLAIEGQDGTAMFSMSLDINQIYNFEVALPHQNWANQTEARIIARDTFGNQVSQRLFLIEEDAGGVELGLLYNGLAVSDRLDARDFSGVQARVSVPESRYSGANETLYIATSARNIGVPDIVSVRIQGGPHPATVADMVYPSIELETPSMKRYQLYIQPNFPSENGFDYTIEVQSSDGQTLSMPMRYLPNVMPIESGLQSGVLSLPAIDAVFEYRDGEGSFSVPGSVVSVHARQSTDPFSLVLNSRPVSSAIISVAGVGDSGVIRASVRGQSGETRLLLADSNLNPRVRVLPVRAWEYQGTSFSGINDPIIQIFDAREIRPAAAGNECDIRGAEFIGFENNTLSAPTCVISYSDLPGGFAARDDGSIIARPTDQVGTHTIGYEVSIYDADGQPHSLDAGTFDVEIVTEVDGFEVAMNGLKESYIQIVEELRFFATRASGPRCPLTTDENAARTDAMAGRLTCLIEYTFLPEELSVDRNGVVTGTFDTIGMRHVEWDVSIFDLYGNPIELSSGAQSFMIESVEPPEMVFLPRNETETGLAGAPTRGGVIGTVRAQSPAGNLIIEAQGPSINESVTRFASRSGALGSLDINVESGVFSLWEEADITIRSYYQAAPHAVSEQTIRAIGFPGGGLRLAGETSVEGTAAVGDVDFQARLFWPTSFVGEERVFNASLDGQWDVRMAIKPDWSSPMEPVGEWRSLGADGTLSFSQAMPAMSAGRVMMQARLVDPSGQTQKTIDSPELLMRVVPYEAPPGELVEESISGIAPFSYRVSIAVPDEFRDFIGNVTWQRQNEEGVWEVLFEDQGQRALSATVIEREVGEFAIRAVLENSESGNMRMTASIPVVALESVDFELSASETLIYENEEPSVSVTLLGETDPASVEGRFTVDGGQTFTDFNIDSTTTQLPLSTLPAGRNRLFVQVRDSRHITENVGYSTRSIDITVDPSPQPVVRFNVEGSFIEGREITMTPTIQGIRDDVIERVDIVSAKSGLVIGDKSGATLRLEESVIEGDVFEFFVVIVGNEAVSSETWQVNFDATVAMLPEITPRLDVQILTQASPGVMAYRIVDEATNRPVDRLNNQVDVVIDGTANYVELTARGFDGAYAIPEIGTYTLNSSVITSDGRSFTDSAQITVVESEELDFTHEVNLRGYVDGYAPGQLDFRFQSFMYDHPLDVINRSQFWLNGEEVEGARDRVSWRFTGLEAGDYTLDIELGTRYGVTKRITEEFTVLEPPQVTCNYVAQPDGSNLVLTFDCGGLSDPNLDVIGVYWATEPDGERLAVSRGDTATIRQSTVEEFNGTFYLTVFTRYQAGQPLTINL